MAIVNFALPKPRNDDDWELWCQKIFASIYGVHDFQRFERRGKNQKGIDLLATLDDGRVIVVQCKRRSTSMYLTKREAEIDYQACLALKPRPTTFIIATTHDRKGLQEWAASKTKPSALVYTWGDIEDRIARDETLRTSLYGALGDKAGAPRDALCYVYGSDFAALDEAMKLVGDTVGDGPAASPAGPYFSAHAGPRTRNTMRKLRGISIYNSPRHSIPKRMYIYIENVDAVPRVEKIVGSLESAPNWEATSLGLCVEVDIIAKDINKLRRIRGIDIFDKPQHTLDEKDRVVHETMRWSKRAASKAQYHRFATLMDFGDAVASAFEDICLVTLACDDVKLEQSERSINYLVYLSHDPAAKPDQGSWTGELGEIVATMAVNAAAALGCDKLTLESALTPFQCINGIVVIVKYARREGT